MLFNKAPEYANLLVTVLGEVESELLAESQLQQIIVERLFAYLDLECGVFQGPPLQLLLARLLVLDKYSIVQLAPSADFLDDLLDGTLLRALGLAGILTRWLRLFLIL